jgi:hypothetical protein
MMGSRRIPRETGPGRRQDNPPVRRPPAGFTLEFPHDPMRILSAILLFAACAGARAELTCEQYGALAQQVVQQRDQGASLKRLLAEVEHGQWKALPPHEIAVVRDVIRYVFNGSLSPPEVVEACVQGGTLVPAR